MYAEKKKWKRTSSIHNLTYDYSAFHVFQGRVPRSVFATHYTGIGFERLKRVYEKANLSVLIL